MRKTYRSKEEMTTNEKRDNNYYPNDVKHREEFLQLDKLSVEITAIISKISADMVNEECNRENREPNANDIIAEYNNGIISFIGKFTKTAQQSLQYYLRKCNDMYQMNKEWR
jgi:hypothetical protein